MRERGRKAVCLVSRKRVAVASGGVSCSRFAAGDVGVAVGGGGQEGSQSTKARARRAACAFCAC